MTAWLSMSCRWRVVAGVDAASTCHVGRRLLQCAVCSVQYLEASPLSLQLVLVVIKVKLAGAAVPQGRLKTLYSVHGAIQESGDGRREKETGGRRPGE